MNEADQRLAEEIKRQLIEKDSGKNTEDENTKEYNIDEITPETILSEDFFKWMTSIHDPFEFNIIKTKCEMKAKEFKLVNSFKRLLNAYRQKQVRENKGYQGAVTNFPDQPLILHVGDWLADAGGIRKPGLTSDGREITKIACVHPILPTEIITNIDTQTEKLKLSFYKNYQWHDIICERAITADSSKIIRLANSGIEVTSETARNLVSYIAACVAKNIDILPKIKAVSHLGWVGNDFMPYTQGIAFDGDREGRSLYEAVSKKGSFEKWLEFIKPLRENKLLRLQMAASFASPIIHKINILPFALHYWGGPLTSGSGKTVSLMVSASIWGDPRMGALVRTMDNTQNATLNMASFLHSIPYFGDELQLIKSKWGNYDQLIMKVCEGVDRGRMSFDKMLPTKTWKNSFLFTGEEAIVKRDSGAGVYSRVIEVEVKEMIVDNGNEVVCFINENYGHAGEAFINAIKDIDLMPQFQAIFKEIAAACDTNEKQAMSMACILLADRLAEEHIFKSGKYLTINDVKDYLFTAEQIDLGNRSYEWVLNWIAKNQNRFEADTSINKGEIWGKIEGNVCTVNKNVLSEHMSTSGMELAAVIGKWANKGLAFRNSQEKFVHQTKVGGVKASYIKFLIDKNEGVGYSEDNKIILPKEFTQQKL